MPEEDSDFRRERRNVGTFREGWDFLLGESTEGKEEIK